MATYFSLILVLVTFVSGIIWALDKLIWEKARAEKVAFAQTQAELPAEAIAKLGQESFIVENAKSIFPVIAAVMVLRSTLIETGKPERGDVAVFKYPPQPTIDYIKRVVGLPGDRIAYRGKQVFIQQACSGTNCAGFKKLDLSLVEIGKFKDQMVELQQYTEQLGDVKHNILINPSRPDLARDFYQQDNPPTRQYEWVVPDGHYFMMGDNRDNSADSRFWGFVPEANLVGKAVFIWTSFEFERDPDSLLPGWIPTGIRFSRIGKLK
ncbi:signal peptidase I [Moritella viscosa]